MYSPWGFYQFRLAPEGYPTPGSGMLNPVQFYGSAQSFDPSAFNGWTVKGLINFGNQLISPLLADTDTGNMMGDILRAYKGSVIKLNFVPDIGVVQPSFNIDVLNQMKNATVLGQLTFTVDSFKQTSNTRNSACVVQITDDVVNGPYLYSRPMVSNENSTWQANILTSYPGDALAFAGDRILTTQTSETSPELVAEATRLMVGGEVNIRNYDPSSETITVDLYPGTEIAVKCYQYKYVVDSGGARVLKHAGIGYSKTVPATAATLDSNDATSLLPLLVASHFRFHPMSIYYTMDIDDPSAPLGAYDYCGINYDIDNYAVLTSDVVRNIHNAVLVSLFISPVIVKG